MISRDFSSNSAVQQHSKVQSHRYKVPSDGAPISPYQRSFGSSGQTKVSGDRQRETTHEICCFAAECKTTAKTRKLEHLH